jgi:hypothetical protein
MQDGAAHWRVLNFLDERESTLAANFQFHQNILASRVAQKRVDIAL